MAKDNSNNCNNNSPLLKEPGLNKSFVKKVQSHVSGLLPSSLSKWFNNDDTNKHSVRQREDEDSDTSEILPPSKRVKILSHITIPNNHTNRSPPLNFNADVTKSIHNPTAREQRQFSDTFLEPMAGPSGIKSRKLILPTTGSIHYNSSDHFINGDKDSDSGESTSGCSSMARISHKDVASCGGADPPKSNIKTENLFNSSFGCQSRSLFMDRSVSPQINSSLSSRRPSFNASTFGSPNFVDRTLSTKRIINSPFYNGRTTFGGASAYGNQRNKLKTPEDMHRSARSHIEVKPMNKTNVSENAALSKTARRILDTLEQYTTPVSDAKKIPNPSLKRTRNNGLLSQYTGVNPYLLREHKSLSSNKELQVPTVPDLLKMKLKERLQDSTVSVRQIATTSKSVLNSDEYKIRTTEEDTPKHTNKIKNKVTSTRQKPDTTVAEEVQLPDIALPITTLPKFDFSLPLPPSCSKPLITVPSSDSLKAPESVPVLAEKLPAKLNSDTIEYKFANPLVLAENLVSIIAINDFKFSEPLNKQKPVTDASSISTCKLKAPEISCNFKSTDPSSMTLKRKNHIDIKSSPQLIQGSVEDILSKKAKPDLNLLDKFKPSLDTWECNTCLIRNKAEHSKCIACQTPKEKFETIDKMTANPITNSSNFGNEFKMSNENWECTSCLVRNRLSDTICVSCSTPKTIPSKLNGPINTLTTEINSFGDQFKPSLSSWECPTCLIRNKNETDKCVACESRKPESVNKDSSIITTGFGNSFKKSNDEWECDVCCIRNPISKSACMACETPKPGANVDKAKPSSVDQLPISAFKFGIFPDSLDSKAQTKENPKSENTEKKTTDISSIFGNATKTISSTTATSATPAFTFGIPTVNPNKTSTVTTNPPPKQEVLFNNVSKMSTGLPKPATGFVFNNTGSSSQTENKLQPVNVPSEKPELKTIQPVIPSVGFTFGKNRAESTKQTENKVEQAISFIQNPTKNSKPSTVPSFTFGASAAPVLTPAVNEVLSSSDKKQTPASTASIVFSPPKQILNKPDSTTFDKPLTINSGKIDKPIFGSTIPSTQTIPNNLFAPQTQPVAVTSANSNLFNFGAKTSTPSVFGGSTITTETPVFKFATSTAEHPTAPSGFGMNTSAPQINNNLFGAGSMFGGPNKPIFETSAAPALPVTSSTVPVATTVAPTFGAGGFGTSTVTSEVKPFSFNSHPSDNTISSPKTFPFSFTPNTQAAAEPAKMPQFNFTASAAPGASTGGFSFNTNTAAAPSVNFNFNATKPDSSSVFQSPPASSTNLFGTSNPIQPPQPQPVQNGGFNFGSTTTASTVKTGFNFGVASTPPQFALPQPASTGVFSFGVSNPNVAPPVAGGFNFGSGPSVPSPAFNANIKPTFNFTGGTTPSFSAQPAVDNSLTQRKKIRAIRRNQR